MALSIPVTVLYGTLSLLYTGALGMNVSRVRGQKKSFVGDTPDAELVRTVRAHGNAAEWAPLLILLLLFLEVAGAGSLLLHVCGGAILASRLMHGVGVLAKSPITALAAGITYLLVVGMPVYALVLRFRS